MPFGSKMSFTKNAYIGKANIPSYSTTNYDQSNATIKSETQSQNQTQGGGGNTTTGSNVTSNVTSTGKMY